MKLKEVELECKQSFTNFFKISNLFPSQNGLKKNREDKERKIKRFRNLQKTWQSWQKMHCKWTRKENHWWYFAASSLSLSLRKSLTLQYIAGRSDFHRELAENHTMMTSLSAFSSTPIISFSQIFSKLKLRHP